MKPAATSHPSLNEQYQAVLQLQSEGRWGEVSARTTALLEGPLQPQQRALLLQVQAEACLSEGDNQQAARLIEQSLQWMWMPDLALRWLEITLPEWVWQEASQEELPWAPAWVAVCQQLVRAGHGPVLIAAVRGLLGELPLEGQRQELLEAMERWQALLLEEQPALKRQWRWLRRLAMGQ